MNSMKTKNKIKKQELASFEENPQLDKPKKSFLKKYKNEFKAYFLLAFPLIWWSIFFVYAFARSFYFSFTDIKFTTDSITKFTFNNYERIFNPNYRYFDKTFWASLKVTLIWTFVMMIGNNVMGLLCAFLINSLKKGKKLFLALLFWPSLVSAIVGADNTKMLFASDSSGFVNKFLSLFNLGPFQWFDDKQFALIGLMITPFFLGFCTKLLIYYASIIAIPVSYKEAASLDTSSKFKIFFNVTLPLMKNAIVLNMVLSLIDGFKVLGPMQLVTAGGPEKSTLSTMLHIYNLAFEDGEMGRASACAFVLFVIILIFTIIQSKLSGKEAATVE